MLKRLYVNITTIRLYFKNTHRIHEKEGKMKKWIIILALVLFLGANLTPAIAGTASQGDKGQQAGPEGAGPAENAGDGISDGSGMDDHQGNDEGSPGEGPAPSSGDGINDGSGF
jgi:hypothetical protein